MMSEIKFYLEINFKETPIGKIPRDWEVADVDFIGVLKGFAFSSEFFREKNEGIPLIRIRDLGKDKTESYYSGPYDATYAVRKGDILLSMDGEFNAYLWNGPDGLLNQRVCKVWSKESAKLDNLFLYYELQKPLKMIEGQIGRTTVKHLLDKDLERLKIPLPLYPEQKKIAEVLSTVDKAIQKVDELILKTERLKKGLVQELLTRGIGHKEYKQTPIGTTPKEWDVVTLGDACDQRNEMFQPSGNNTYKFVGLEHITSGETRMHTYVQDVAVKSSKFKFYPEDILYGKLRPYLDKAVLVDFDGICSTDLLVLKPQEKIVKEFLIYVLHSKEFLKHAVATTSGTNHPRTSWTAISKFKFGLPEHSEQQKIAETLSAIDKKVELENKEKARLERIKLGLMNLLLTGKIRVKVD